MKKKLFNYTWPIFLELILMMLLGNVDTFMLSKYSEKAVAAVGNTNQILSVLIILFGVVSSATGILISQSIGAKKTDKISEIFTVSMISNITFGIVLSLFLFIFKNNIFEFIKIPTELMHDAKSYIDIVGGFLFIQAGIMVATTVLRTHGYMKQSMFITVGINIINIIGNYIFLFGNLNLSISGVRGVALSTSISRSVGLMVMLYVIHKHINIKVSVKAISNFPKETFLNIMKIGLPTAGEQFSYNASQLVILSFINSMGVISINTKIYTSMIVMFSFLFALALSQGSQILIGQLAGAKETEVVDKLLKTTLKAGMILSLIVSGMFFVFNKSLYSIFTSNEEVFVLGGKIMMIEIALELGRAINLIVIGALRSTGDVKFPVAAGVVSMWGISVFLSYVFGIIMGMGLVGVWLAFATDELFRGMLMILRWRSGKWKNMAFVK